MDRFRQGQSGRDLQLTSLVHVYLVQRSRTHVATSLYVHTFYDVHRDKIRFTAWMRQNAVRHLDVISKPTMHMPLSFFV